MNNVSRTIPSFLIPAALLLLLILITYSNSFTHPFMMDDHYFLVQNKVFHNLKYWHYQFIPDLRQHLGIEGGEGDNYYRPLAHLLPMAAFALFRDQPAGYHALNVALFYGACLLLWRLAFRLTGRRDWAFAAAVLFSVHPINGVMVNYKTASVFSMQLILLSACVLFFSRSLVEKRRSWTAAAVFCFVLSLLCHETSMALPLYLAALLLFYQGRAPGFTLKRTWPYFAVLAGYLGMRLSFASLHGSVISKVTAGDFSILSAFATFGRLAGWYLQQIFWPDSVVLMKVIPFLESGALLTAGLMIVILALFAIVLWKRERWPLFSLAAGWLIVGFLPVTAASFFKKGYGLMIEPHWMFFASTGVFICVAAFLLGRSPGGTRWRALLFAGMVLALSLRTYSDNRDWKDEKIYAARLLRHSPNLRLANFYLGQAHLRDGELNEAQTYLLRAREGTSLDWEVYANLALIAQNRGEYDTAVEYNRRALEYYPQSSAVLNNLGQLFIQMEDLAGAEKYLRQSVEVNPYFMEGRLNLSRVYEQQDRIKEAFQILDENLDIDPRNRKTLWRMFEIHIRNPSARADDFYQQVLASVKDPVWLVNGGSLLAESDKVAEALAYHERALRVNPDYIPGYMEAAKLLANIRYHDAALEMLEEGMNRDPDFPGLPELYEEVSKQFGESSRATPVDEPQNQKQ